MNNKPFSFTDKDAVAKFFGDLNEIVYGVNTYTPEHDEKPHAPAPTDEELDRMHDAWDSQRVDSEHKQYENSH